MLENLLLLGTIHLLAAASPGPDFALISQQALGNGRRAALWCAVGVALGLSIHIAYSALGLATLIANSSELLWWLRIVAGIYLVYLGWQALRASFAARGRDSNDECESAKTHEQGKAGSAMKYLGLGFLCNALNPKAPVYFVAVFTLVLSADMAWPELVVYGFWMMLIQLLWFGFLAMVLTHRRVAQRFGRMAHWLDRVLGGALLAMGIKLLATRN